MFKTFSGLDYLKISVANAAGKDKLLFEERIQWFNNHIQESVVTMDNQQLYEYCLTFDEPESIELLFTGLLAYQDYFYGRKSGFRCQLDAVCSGVSIMSALTADKLGLDHTGLITDRRGDAYTAIFNRFKEICPIKVNSTRKQIKDFVMQTMYGSHKALIKCAMEMLGYNHLRVSELDGEEIEKFLLIQSKLIEALNTELNGAWQLQQLLVNTWNPESDTHQWVLPDGFTVVARTKKEKFYEYSYEDGEGNEYSIPYSLKEYSPLDKAVKNCPNSIHSIDGLLMREMYRRTMFDESKYQQVLFYLVQCPKDLYEPTEEPKDNLDRLNKLYEDSLFVSVEICNYINSISDVARINPELVSKLINILDLMLKQGYIECSSIHDCIFCLPNNMNYIRYWYKELIANIVDSNMLPFMYNQLYEKEQIEDAITKEYRKEVANLVRNSNYGIC